MCSDDGGGINAFIRNSPCAFNYNIYPIFVQCYVMGRFGHENVQNVLDVSLGRFGLVFFHWGPDQNGPKLGPLWSGAFCFQWAVFDIHWGRSGDGPFWSVPDFWYLTPGLPSLI